MKRAYILAVAGLVLAGTGLRAGDEKGTVVNIEGLKSRTPANWEPQKSTNKFRKYQFRLAGKEGKKSDAQLLVLYLGGSSGGTEDNVKRWQKMFVPPAGKTIDEVTKIEKTKVAGTAVMVVDIHGTYLERFPPFDPDARITRRPDYRRINVIFETADGPYFITLTGPAATVGHYHKGFEQWLKAFK
jgi:hypothetical protein